MVVENLFNLFMFQDLRQDLSLKEWSFRYHFATVIVILCSLCPLYKLLFDFGLHAMYHSFFFNVVLIVHYYDIKTFSIVIATCALSVVRV